MVGMMDYDLVDLMASPQAEKLDHSMAASKVVAMAVGKDAW